MVSFINELLFNTIALEERVPIRDKFIKVVICFLRWSICMVTLIFYFLAIGRSF